MNDTTTKPNPTAVVDVDQARDLVAAILSEYVANAGPEVESDELELAAALAANVKGWTHTTRLRDFLAGVNS